MFEKVVCHFMQMKHRKRRYRLEQKIRVHDDFKECSLKVAEPFREDISAYVHPDRLSNEAIIKYKHFSKADKPRNGHIICIFIRADDKGITHNSGHIIISLGNLNPQRRPVHNVEFKNIIFSEMVHFKSHVSTLNLSFENCIFYKPISFDSNVISSFLDPFTSLLSKENRDKDFLLDNFIAFKNCFFHSMGFYQVKFEKQDPFRKKANIIFEDCIWTEPYGTRGDILNFRKTKVSRGLFRNIYFPEGSLVLGSDNFSDRLSFEFCTFRAHFWESSWNSVKTNLKKASIVFRNCKFKSGCLSSGVNFFQILHQYFLENHNNIQAYEFYVLIERSKNEEIRKHRKGQGKFKYLLSIFSWRNFYQFFSLYGSSIWRPSLAFLFTSVLSAFLLYQFGEIQVECESYFYHRLVAVISGLARTFGAFSDIKPLGLFSETIVLLCNILQSIFIILFIIALRRRFKVGY